MYLGTALFIVYISAKYVQGIMIILQKHDQIQLDNKNLHDLVKDKNWKNWHIMLSETEGNMFP